MSAPIGAAGEERRGSEWTGLDGTGPDRSGTAGADGSGLEGTGADGSGTAGLDRNGTDGRGGERTGADWTGVAGLDRTGRDWTGRARDGAERSGRTGQDGTGRERNGLERNGAERLDNPARLLAFRRSVARAQAEKFRGLSLPPRPIPPDPDEPPLVFGVAGSTLHTLWGVVVLAVLVVGILFLTVIGAVLEGAR